jgi:hypothetical protein
MSILVVSGFPGVGKSFFYKRNQDTLSIADSDSSRFSWADEAKTIRNPHFIEDYVAHVRSIMREKDVVLVSSHLRIREALYREGINFICVYPYADQKEEYLRRFRTRGSNEKFLANLAENFVPWVREIDEDVFVKNKLKIRGYLSDIFMTGDFNRERETY